MDQTEISSTLRVIRRLWPRRNELMRRVDWIEAALLVTVVTIGLVLLPVALMLGSETYAAKARLADEQARIRHQATAILLVDAPPVTVGADGAVATSGSSAVQARWHTQDGATRVGLVQADDGLHAGSEVPVWLGPAGNPVDRPLTSADATESGVTVAAVTWTVAAVLLAALFATARAALNRSRSAAWQRDWARVEPDWSHRHSI